MIRVRAEYCDVKGCPARALRIVVLSKGEICLCRHHFQKYEKELVGHVLELEGVSG